jgi:hypothetical protein
MKKIINLIFGNWSWSICQKEVMVVPNTTIQHDTSIITNFMGHDLAILIVQNLLFIGLYGIDTNVIHLLVLFEHWCRVHCLDTNVMCLFILFRYRCCMSIHVVYIRKSCTLFSCLNNARHLCLNNTNLRNNRFHINFEWTHEAYKFVMMVVLSNL